MISSCVTVTMTNKNWKRDHFKSFEDFNENRDEAEFPITIENQYVKRTFIEWLTMKPKIYIKWHSAP